MHLERVQRRVGALRAWQLDLSSISEFPVNRQPARPPKKRGAPATGKGEPILVRVQPAQLAARDAWIASQDAQLSRPEAIRRLIDQALARSPPLKRRAQRS
jgi:hypothetical protein